MVSNVSTVFRYRRGVNCLNGEYKIIMIDTRSINSVKKRGFYIIILQLFILTKK